ncbi:MAG: hypothetical protein LBE13_02930 [Bacteroidales bacterium]|jgi:hypothetical protein|nr:hypothetical protein [Bacteroidales bacterium]
MFENAKTFSKSMMIGYSETDKIFAEQSEIWIKKIRLKKDIHTIASK